MGGILKFIFKLLMVCIALVILVPVMFLLILFEPFFASIVGVILVVCLIAWLVSNK